ncbi:MAG TPA: hypothetical protein VFZ59_11115 [Verrucomicrobiae bacterium]|nr:hypothetical protein [Verrucomicrobiae bacterium]
METEQFNKGHSFRVACATYGGLCRAVSKIPGVIFTRKRKFFWSFEDICAEFTFRGCEFQIQADTWDGALWILTKDQAAHTSEIQELREAVEQSRLSFIGRILFKRLW